MFEVSDQQGNCHSIAGMKVLVVEDKVVNLSVLMKLLNEIGLNITIAPDGEVALNLIPKLKPDLILLDIMLPEMDGFEVCIKVKADEATKNIPIIFKVFGAFPETIKLCFISEYPSNAGVEIFLIIVIGLRPYARITPCFS